MNVVTSMIESTAAVFVAIVLLPQNVRSERAPSATGKPAADASTR